MALQYIIILVHVLVNSLLSVTVGVNRLQEDTYIELLDGHLIGLGLFALKLPIML